jgi:hypothetical protein
MIGHRSRPDLSRLRLADAPPTVPTLTPYDEAHLPTYLRLLDAERDGAAWEEVCRLVLGLDPEANPDLARRCWRAHLERALWMCQTGYLHLVTSPRE